ncbi:hypothetical protein [Arthrobacter nitrophenolicus]|uniref:hypothetical protein n=1 Tax=Arthrobacter nitrophenolicus TaxID=683150 RepID=UPI00140523CF|nr:hypothetical protein [Arthrobacter nitrophenolicus]
MKQSTAPAAGSARVSAPTPAPTRKAMGREHQLRQLINDLADLAAKHRPPHPQSPASV